MNSTFQHGFLRLRLNAALSNKLVKEVHSDYIQLKFTLQTEVIGLRPRNVIKIRVTYLSNHLNTKNLYFLCKYRNVFTKRKILEVPFETSRLLIPITWTIIFQEVFHSKIKLLLCSDQSLRPLAAAIIFPFAEEVMGM